GADTRRQDRVAEIEIVAQGRAPVLDGERRVGRARAGADRREAVGAAAGGGDGQAAGAEAVADHHRRPRTAPFAIAEVGGDALAAALVEGDDAGQRAGAIRPCAAAAND